MVKIIPAILPKDTSEWSEKFSKVKGLVERVQLDIVDGVFAEAKTLEPHDLIGESLGGTKLDVQLMVDEPIEWLGQCKAVGADRVIGHIEKMEDPLLFIAEAEVQGFGVGVALDIGTPVEKIKNYIDQVDLVLLMADKAGQSGKEPFNNQVLDKIEGVRKMSETVVICVDGGLDVEEIKKCIAAEWAQEIKDDELQKDFLGMEFAVGRALWNASDTEKKLRELEALKNG